VVAVLPPPAGVVADGLDVSVCAIADPDLHPGRRDGECPDTRERAPAAGEKPKLTPREFYVLDRDRSGYLTPDEVAGDAMLEQNFNKIDKNQDGRISLEEFTNFSQ